MLKSIDFAAERGLTESRAVAAGAGALGNKRRDRFLCALGLRLHILLDVFVGELLDDAFHCNIHCLSGEVHLHFSRLAVQQLSSSSSE